MKSSDTAMMFLYFFTAVNRAIMLYLQFYYLIAVVEAKNGDVNHAMVDSANANFYTVW